MLNIYYHGSLIRSPFCVIKHTGLVLYASYQLQSIYTIMPRRNGKALASLSKKVAKNTRILGQREVKRVKVTIDSTPDTTAVMQNVSAVAEGLGSNERNGRMIHAVGVQIGGITAKNPTATFNALRFVLFRDNLGTTTAPVVTDLFDSESDFFDNKPRTEHIQKRKRFTVLWDKHIILNESFDGNVSAKSFKFSKKLNFRILYSGSAITTEGRNSLWLISGSDEATNVPSVDADIIFKYTDL